MSNSSLVVYTKLSPNHSGKRTKKIDTITIHCMAGNCSVETCGNLFANSARQASSNYGIGTDGRIALYVDEARLREDIRRAAGSRDRHLQAQRHQAPRLVDQ